MMRVLLLAFSMFAMAWAGSASSTRVAILQEGYVREIDGQSRVSSTVAVVISEDAVVVCDPGMVPDKKRLLESLAREGVDPEDVTHVFISHHHPDHTVNIALFPNARVVDYGSIYFNDLWLDHEDNYEIAPGIRVVATAGHTFEGASLLVATEQGVYAFTHLWWHEDMTPEIDPLAEDQNELEKSRALILETADWIVPGHGKMFENPEKQ